MALINKAALFLSSVALVGCVQAASSKEASSRLPAATSAEKVKLFGRIDKLSAACAAAGVLLESRQMPTKILKVRLGSPASYAGLSVDDQVLAGTIYGDKMRLSISRDGKPYQVDLRIEPDNLSPAMLAVNRNKSKLQGGIDNRILEATRLTDWRRLSRYQIAILLDHSGSMGEAAADSDLTRWQWCAGQIEDFASEAQRMSVENITFCIFNHEFTVSKNCDMTKLRKMLDKVSPEGGTDMAAPIRQVTEAYLSGPRKKPLLLGIVTDCETNGGASVEKVLIDVSRRIKDPLAVRVVVFQVGDSGDGADFARRLDNDLVANGAASDIVKSFYFDDLWMGGLRRSLAKAVTLQSN